MKVNYQTHSREIINSIVAVCLSVRSVYSGVDLGSKPGNGAPTVATGEAVTH